MRGRGAALLAAYAAVLLAGALLAVGGARGIALPAAAQIGAVPPAPRPPLWAFIRVGPAGGTLLLLRTAVRLLGGYPPTAAGAVAAAFPGLAAPIPAPPPPGAVPT